jgi:hypothetical protein
MNLQVPVKVQVQLQEMTVSFKQPITAVKELVADRT